MEKPVRKPGEDLCEPVTFPAETYTSREYAEAEADRLWAKVWQHADRIEAFHNVCPHRGRRLVRVPRDGNGAPGAAGSGSTWTRIACPCASSSSPRQVFSIPSSSRRCDTASVSGLEVYSHSSASHLTCLAVGLQTERIRVVTGIMNLCPPINHSVRVAEQIALIDILTDGRVELGTGRGSGSTEVNTFGLFNEQTRELWEEAVRAIPKMWTQDLFSWEGKHFSVPERCILPKPIQKPHPPMWVTSSNPETVEVAGRMGLGVAVFSFQDPLVLRPLVDTYKKAIEDPDPISEVVNNKFVTIAPLVCMEDGDEARRLQDARAGQIDPWFATYFDTVRALAERTEDEPRPIKQSRLREMVEQARADEGLPGPFAKGMTDPKVVHENGICAGTPDEVTETVGRYRSAGIDQLVMLPRLASWMEDEEQVWESMRLFGREVIPKFKT